MADKENNEMGRGENTNEQNRESEKNDIFTTDDYELLEGINITSSNTPNHTEAPSSANIAYRPLTADESAYMKCCMEARIATLPVHTPECGHPNVERDIEDCDLCWVKAAMDVLWMRLKIKGSNYELIKHNCDKLMNCYKDEETGYPYILKKAFKWIQQHNVCKAAFYPSEADCNMPHEVPEEVKALRLKGFQMLDHEDKYTLEMAIADGPIIGGVRESPDFTMVGNRIYHGSNYELEIEGKSCNHGLVVYGFNKGESGYWMVKNSILPSWGDKGRGKVSSDLSLDKNKRFLLTSTMCPILE